RRTVGVSQPIINLSKKCLSPRLASFTGTTSKWRFDHQNNPEISSLTHRSARGALRRTRRSVCDTPEAMTKQQVIGTVRDIDSQPFFASIISSPPGFSWLLRAFFMETIKPKVLIIDDDPIHADTLAMVLNISGFTATVAYSGEQGIELARAGAFDHLVTDVMMESMSGIEAAIAIRQVLPQCRILLISGNN